MNIRTIHGEMCGNMNMTYKTENATGDLALYFYPFLVEKDDVMSKLGDAFTPDKVKTLNTSVTSNNVNGFDSLYANDTTKKVAVMPAFPSTASANLTWLAVQNTSTLTTIHLRQSWLQLLRHSISR
jgi:hypothetical protein